MGVLQQGGGTLGKGTRTIQHRREGDRDLTCTNPQPPRNCLCSSTSCEPLDEKSGHHLEPFQSPQAERWLQSVLRKSQEKQEAGMRGYITGLGCAPQLGHGVLRSHPPITG